MQRGAGLCQRVYTALQPRFQAGDFFFAQRRVECLQGHQALDLSAQVGAVVRRGGIALRGDECVGPRLRLVEARLDFVAQAAHDLGSRRSRQFFKALVQALVAQQFAQIPPARIEQQPFRAQGKIAVHAQLRGRAETDAKNQLVEARTGGHAAQGHGADAGLA